MKDAERSETNVSQQAPSQQWMREAVLLAQKSLREDFGGPFGAVIVCDGQVAGRGQNQVTRLHDPTAHAEISAIRDACRALGRFDLRGCEIYTSCEPCPMCLAAIYWSRLEKIYYACTRADAAAADFDDDFIYQQIPLEIEARSIPMNQIGRDQALSVFQEWAAKPDKIPY